MANEQWEKMVEKASFYCEDDGEGLNPVLFADVAIKLLRRQHAAVVRMVKKLADQSQSYDVQEFTVKLLAALAEQKSSSKKKD